MADMDDLFGSEDEDEVPQQPVAAPVVEGSPEPEGRAPAAAAGGKVDMKARLAALAAAKRQEQAS